MTLHFPTHELAALAVAKLRDDGHYAEVLDAAVSGLWGPAVTGGVRVLASEEFMDEGIENPVPPEPSKVCAALDHFFRVLLQTAWLVAISSFGLIFLSVVLTNLFAFVLGLLEITVAMCLMAVWSMICHQGLSNSILRGQSGLADPICILVVAIVLLALAATRY